MENNTKCVSPVILWNDIDTLLNLKKGTLEKNKDSQEVVCSWESFNSKGVEPIKIAESNS